MCGVCVTGIVCVWGGGLVTSAVENSTGNQKTRVRSPVPHTLFIMSVACVRVCVCGVVSHNRSFVVSVFGLIVLVHVCVCEPVCRVMVKVAN